jgi:hypothetical protein
MRRLALPLLALATALGLAGPGALPAAALTLVVDPAASSIASGSSGEALSGSVDVQVGAGSPAANRSFDVVGLDLQTAGGTRIRLDPAAPSPGLGVVGPTGSVLLGTLFLQVEDGGSVFPIAIPDVPGQATFVAGSLDQLATAFQIDSGSGGLLDVTLVARAVPEPAALGLLAVALALVARRRPRKETR